MLQIPIEQKVIDAFCRKHHIERISVFGSAQRPDFVAGKSDIDLFVEYLPGHHPGWDMILQRNELEAIFGTRVDLLTELPSRFHKRVESDLEVIYSCHGKA
tara:strand:- start:4671 stop:4973 length:303 start_codon:yes stop_codon:yes gene_type:complete